MSERVGEARRAYEARELDKAREAHEKARIEEDIYHKKATGQYIGDLVYGGLDGVITTFAVVSGAAGASLSASVVLILGFANLFGDGFSMAAGNYLSSKSEAEFKQKERERELWEVDNIPEGELEELRQIYLKRGIKSQDVEAMVRAISSDKNSWVDTMMVEELGLITEDKSAVKSALASFLSFLIVGFFPLSAYVLSLILPSLLGIAFRLSILVTATAVFAVGSARSLVTGKKWYMAGLEMTAIGGLAALVAYLCGVLLSGLAA